MELPKRPNFSEYEPELADFWEKNHFFTPKTANFGEDKLLHNEHSNAARIDPNKEPFTIILPPPNANAPLHAGHALYVIEDILCRYHRMNGHPTLFLPGTDHAGIETQYVLEKNLKKEGKSRFDYDRESLYQLIHDFVEENRGIATAQLRRLGFSLDWSREKYTLDPAILETVYDTFRKLHKDGLIYRDERLVNYCTTCGTGFSNLEIDHVEETTSLYYMKYGPFTLATTRPETKFGDTAVAVNPNDERYKHLIGTEFTYESLIGPKHMKVVGDLAVDMEFGTGAVKVTPAHDYNDYEIAERHGLDKVKVIDRFGRLTDATGRFAGMKVKAARAQVVEELQAKGDIVKIDEAYKHRISKCYKCQTVIEPLLVPQWYVRIQSLIESVETALDNHEVEIFPDRFNADLRRWLETAPDWNISRQIVWGPRIPAWYDLTEIPDIEITFLDSSGERVTGLYQDLKDAHSFEIIRKGLQNLVAPVHANFYLDPKDAPSEFVLQETDTFDTWFSSGQWPLTTLGYPNGKDFTYFYPTSVLDTMWDILPFWVMRMLLFGVYLTGKVPFKTVHLHSRVVDLKGQKMSKSKGNVINPMELTEKYGADAFRFALVFGIAPASDIPLGEEKMVGGRNFVTKIWNVSRFILGQVDFHNKLEIDYSKNIDASHPSIEEDDKFILEKLDATIKQVSDALAVEGNNERDRFQFARALDALYTFIWDDFASWYIETVKSRVFTETPSQSTKSALFILAYVWRESLKLLHPFMPFITEEIFQKLPNKDTVSIGIAAWPQTQETQKK